MIEQRRSLPTGEPRFKKVDEGRELDVLGDEIGNLQVGSMRPLAFVRLVAVLVEKEVLRLCAPFFANVLNRGANDEAWRIRPRCRRAVARKPDLEPVHRTIGDQAPTDDVFRFIRRVNEHASRS